MTLSRMNRRTPRSRRGPASWLERVMAAIALINLLLVLFDLSYIRFRDVYLRFLPQLTTLYGEQVKGIEPDRTTSAYLALADELTAQLRSGAPDEQTVEQIVDQLTLQSREIIDEDPFALAGKSGTLERVKNRMRDRMDESSAKAAFRDFWTEQVLNEATQEESLDFFETSIRPLIATNYYRGIGESGGFIDWFWVIDLPFVLLFAAEFLLRTYVISRRQRGTSWFDAMLWRAYDIPLFVGLWRWLRVIPVTLRLHQAHWVNLEPMRNRLSRALVSQFAVELTEIVLLRVIDQSQKFVQEGDVTRLILSATDRQQYIDINGINEVETLAKRVSDVLVYQVLPRIKPELDALLQHSVVGALDQAPAYQGLKFVPGFENISEQISRQVVSELSKTLTNTLQSALADEKSALLTSQLIDSIGDALRQAIQRTENIDEIRLLVNDLLEEVKLNYVRGIAQEDLAQQQAARYRLYSVAGRGQ